MSVLVCPKGICNWYLSIPAANLKAANPLSEATQRMPSELELQSPFYLLCAGMVQLYHRMAQSEQNYYLSRSFIQTNKNSQGGELSSNLKFALHSSRLDLKPSSSYHHVSISYIQQLLL